MNDTSLTLLPPTAELVRQSSDVAGLCKAIVTKTALEIQGRKFVRVEGWQSIATAHGCIASSCDVKQTEQGTSARGEIRRMSDGQLLATAEGFVGIDEPTWYGGEAANGKTLPKRPDYAIRAMAQTRAISRACRSAFAHVVVLMDAGLSTTPAEEVPEGGFNDAPEPRREPERKPAESSGQTTTSKGITITKHEEKTGTSARGAWTRAIFTFDNGLEAGTFDKTLAAKAKFLMHVPCDTTVKEGQKPGRFDLIEICESDDIQM